MYAVYFKNKKVIALLLIVSQLIVNAGMQTFAVSFSKVMSKTLEGMEQPEDISTRYYEEFSYEARTYLFNDGENFDGESFDEKKSDNDNIDENEFNDEKNTDEETKENVNVDDKKEETTNVNDKDDIDEYDDSLDDIKGDYEDVPEELDDDGNVINPTTRPSRNEEYEEEPEVEPEEEDGARETRPYEEEPEEETTVGASTASPEEETTEETSEENAEIEDNVGASTASPDEETTVGESPEEETAEDETRRGERLSEPEEETTIASSSEADDEEGSQSSPVQDEEETEETNEITKIDGSEVATESEVLPLEKIASTSDIELLNDKLLGADPIGGDGTHVHKICGVAEGAACLHTEVGEHTEIGDYRLIAADDDEIMAAIIDDLIGRVDDGLGNYENVVGPEYLVLGRDIEFDKTVEGNPRDADTTTDFYTINLVRDLYLCLNGHSIKNIRWTSSTNKQLFITNCGAPAEVSSVNMPANYSILDLNVKTFGVNKNIIIRSGRLASLENAERCKSTFFGTIFDGYNTTAGVQYVFQITYDNASLVVTLEDCEFRNYKNDAGTAQAQVLIRMNTKATLVLKNVKIHDNDGIQNHIFIMTNSSSIGKLTTKGRCEIYNNNMSTGTTNANFLHWSRTTVTIEDEGLFVYNNSKTPGACYANISNGGTVTVKEGSTLSFDNNKLAKAVNNNSTLFIYVSGTMNVYGNLYVTNNKIINCGTSNTGVAIAGVWAINNMPINIANGLIKIQDNKAYSDDGGALADDRKYKAQHTYQVYVESKDTSDTFRMISGYKFNPANRIGPVGFPSGQSGKIMKFTTDEVDDPSIVDTVFKVDTYYFKDYIVEVKDGYARAVHRESDHKHKECGVAMGAACTHQEVAAHTNEIMYYELSGDLAVSGRAELITGFSTTDATEYFYLTDDIDSSSNFTTITLKRNVYICLNGHSIIGMRFAMCEKTVVICNCKENKVLWRTSGSGTEMYLFDCNAYMYGNQNKNIKLESYGVGRIAAGYGSKIYMYGIDIDSANTTGYNNRSRAYVNKNGGHFIMENVDLHNCHTTTERFMYVRGDDKAGGSFTIRDVNSYDMSELVYQIVRIGGKSGAEGTFTIKGNCSFNDIKMSANSSHLVYGDTYSSMIIDEGATLTFNGNTITSGADCIFKMAGANAKLRMRGRSKLIIENNSLSKTTANQGFLLFDSGTHYLFGDIEIKNNNIINCNGKKSDYIGGLLASKDATLYIGSGSIKIDNNKAYLDNKVTLVDDKAIPQHHMYGFISGKTDLALNQYEGTKFSPETYIPNFAFMGYSAGTIAKWTPNEYEEYYKASFSELIIADTTYTPDFKVVYEEDNLIVKSASTHFHKVCGVAETEACLHTEIAEHTENYQWSAARVDSVDAFVQSITGTDGATGSSYYYLSDDIVATALTTITPKRDVYLCLNGHDLKNFLFRGTKSIYITNCQTDLSTIENKTTNLTFEANVYIYGIDDNILFSSNRVCDVKSNNTESHFFNLIVDGQNADGGGSYATFYLKNDSTVRKLVLEEVTVLNVTAVTSVLYYDCTTTASKAIMKNIEIKDCSTSGQLVYISSSVTAEFKGKNLFHNNVHTSSSNMFHFMTTGGTTVQDEGIYIYDNVTTGNAYQHANFGKKFNLAENATISFLRNQINKYGSNRSVLVYFEDGADINFRGNFEVRDNKVVNAGTQANHYVAAVGILSKKSINIGSGRIIIKDNKCYKDNGITPAEDSTYVAQHMFNLLSISKDVNLFNVIDGCKLNPETRIEGAAFYSASGVGKIVDWTSAVTDDLDAYKNMFIADKFFNPILERRIKNNTLVLDYDELSENAHNHKICGVSTRSACTHTIFENHTEGIPYKPLSENLVKDKEIFITLITDQTGGSTEPNYFYLTTDLVYNTSGEAKKINFDVDTYICLNGHTIRGYQLLTQGGKFMNITNCNSTMGAVQLNYKGNLPFNTNTRVYGVNKNITLKTPRLCYTSTLVNEFYSFILDPDGISAEGYSVIHSGANSKVMIEDVDFKSLVKPTRIINVNDGVANTNFVFKNVTFKDGTTGAPNCQFYFGNQTTCNIDIYSKFEITGNNFKLFNAGGGLFATNAAKVTIHDGAALNIINNTVSKRGGIFYCNNGNVIVEAGGKLSVSGNTIYKNTDTGQYSGNTEIVYVGSGQKFTVLGELAVNDNKIVNCGTNGAGSYMSALSLYGANNSITVGNGKITVDNNSAFSNEEGTTAANDRTYKNHHLFQVYSYNTKLVFKQAEGTKFNTDSRITVTMQGISEGKVVDWNSSTTDNISAYSSIFKTDYFGDPDPMLVVYKNNAINLVSSANYHLHKICGIASNSTCTHTLITTRHNNVEFARLGSTISADQFVNTIKGASGQAAAYYYLRGDVTTTSEKEVALQRDVYLCLNGYSISGFRFTGNGRKIYICNCRDDKVSTIKNILSTNLLFTTNVQIYGSTNNNIKVNSGRVIDVTTTIANNSVSFYNVNFDGSGAKDIIFKSGKTTNEYTSLYFNAYTTNFENCILQNFTNNKKFLFETINATVNLKNVTFTKNKKFKWGMFRIGNTSYGGTINVDGYVDILSNESKDSNDDYFFNSYGNINVKDNARLLMKGNIMSKNKVMIVLYKNANITTGENSYFGIVENTMDKFTGSETTGFIMLDAAAKDLTIKGDFEIRGNKINNCGTSTTGNYLYGIYLPANRYINVGSGKITIQNNKSYSNNGTTLANDTKYEMQHLYQLYADYSSHKSNGIFKVISGKKLNPESRIEGIALTAYNYNGNIVKWDSSTVDEANIDKYKDMFAADPYKDDELDVGYDASNNWVVLEFGAPKHKHKLCGVATTANCIHTAAASHGDALVGYRKLTKELDRSTLTSSFAGGGAFVLLDDIDPAALGDGGAKNMAVTVSNDLYLCLNGHALKGITFTGGTAKTIYITNCSTSKGTFENTVNSTAAFTNISAEIYGINKNINVRYNKLAYLSSDASNNQRVRFYSASFKQGITGKCADSFMYLTQGSANLSSIEDCDFDGMQNYSFFRSNGARTVIIKDSTFKNMTLENYFMSFDGGTHNVSFRGTNIIDKIKYANTASNYFIHFGSYAANEVKVNGNLTIKNCESYYNTNHFFHISEGHVTIDENSKLTINNNRLYNTAIYGRALLYLGNNADFNLYGDLEIRDNAFIGTRQSHSDAGLWYANANRAINVGSTSIVISNNTTTNARANVRNLYSYFVSGIFNQKAGTKFNALESMIDSVAINSEDYTGVIYSNWDGANVEGYADVYYSEIFKADTYGGRKGIITARDGEKVIITFGDHFHKVCGTLATMSCVHTGIDDHGIGTTPDIMHTYLALRWDSMSELANKLSLGGDYFLIRKIKFDSPTVIDLQDNLYLCLTSYYIENAIFTSSTGKKAYISTCIEQFEEQHDDEEEEEQDFDENGNPIPSPTANMGSKRNDRYEVALVATASGAGAMFNSAVELYSPYKLLNVYANKLYESSGSSEPVILSGVNLHNDPKTANAGNYIEITGDEEIVLEGVSISTMSNVGCVVKTENSTLTLCGEINIYRNEDLRSLFDVKSINQKNGSVKVYDNLIKRVGGKQNIIKVSTASYLYGALEVTNNKIINADAGNNSGVFAIFNVASPGYIHIGNTKIYMEENNAYSDSGNTLTDLDAYPCHYVYSIYSNNFDGMFVQDKGTSMDASSRVNVSFDGPKYRGTVVKSWSSGDVYDTVFTADHNIDGDTGFNRIRMNVALEGSDVIIDDRIRIYFKEGISEYKKIGNSPISIYQIVSWGDPYELGTMFKWGGRELVGYRDERGVYYRLGKYPKGLVLNRGSITLTALWHHRSSDANIIDPGQKYDDVLIKRDAVIIGGRWVYDRINKKWMYYLNSNVSENVVDSLFPNGDSGIFVGMSSTDMRRYLRNGIYQIYYNGESYFFRFDENGYMITGLSEANGSYYYFTESGVLEGAMQLDPIVMGDKKIIFDVYGRIVREMDPSSGDVQIIRATYQKMEGMDDYYEPIPSLVGWN